VLALESPTVAELADFLSDPDTGVRRTAVSTLVEHLPAGYAGVLLGALGDDDSEVRRVAADGVRELVEVVPAPEDIAEQLNSVDPVVRAVALYLLSARRVGDQGQYRHALADVDHRVRIEAVRALVSVDDADGVAAAAGDDNREVRIVAANGLSTLRTGADAVRRLVGDSDPLVRAAALTALGTVGFDDHDLAEVKRALTESAWQVREGAARALAGAAPKVAVPTLSRAPTDQHLDVRKAAVLTLTRWAASEQAARDALGLAIEDGDADVRAYARHALAAQLS
jgi:HEAT repeat protein